MACRARALLSFSQTGSRATPRLGQTLPVALEGQDLPVCGRIAGLPLGAAQGLQLHFFPQTCTGRRG
jgi:hypothetical protein